MGPSAYCLLGTTEWLVEQQFEDTLAWIDINLGDAIPGSAFSRVALFYSLFLAIADCLYGIPGGQGLIDSLQRRLNAPTRSELEEKLAELSAAVRAKTPPPDLATFAIAAGSQTDNVGPRQVRHEHLVRLLANL